jgi:dihydroorotate dehydrogenase electron transfer subunit
MTSAGLHPPRSPPRRSQFRCRVLNNTPLCREHYRLVLGLPSFPATEPGQFVQVSCRTVEGLGDAHLPGERELEWSDEHRPLLDKDESYGPVALLRRPFSLAGRRDTPGGVELDLIHRVVGVGTDWLSRLKVGDAVDVLGPLGNRFALPPDGATAVLVGGGVGIPPMLYLAERLAGRPAVAFSGALSKDLLPLGLKGEASPEGEPSLVVEEFSRHGIPAVVTTDDGSYGYRGFVTQALERHLERSGFRVQGSREGSELRVQGSGQKNAAASSSSLNPEPRTLNPIIYTCGPEPMMKRVAEIAATRGLECQVAVERAMACGMGTCQSCCIRVRKPDPSQPPLVGRDWCYRLACTDGPVFRGADLLW